MDFLRQAHGVLMFMDASTFFNSSDIGFMNNRLDKEGVASIVIVGNKVDILCANNTYRQRNYSLNNALSEIKNKLTTQFNEKKFHSIILIPSRVSYSHLVWPTEFYRSLMLPVICYTVPLLMNLRLICLTR